MRKPWYPAFVIALGVAIGLEPPAGHADEHPIASRITAVTVQLERARVVRRAEPVLAAGRQTLVFPDLPVALDRSTVRLASTTPGVEFGRPTFREVETTGPVGPTARRISETVDRLQRRQRIERDGIRARELVLDVLRQSRINLTPDDLADLGDAGPLFGMIASRSKEALQAIRTAEQNIEDLDAEIDRYRRELERLGDDPMRRLELGLPVTAEAAGPVTLTLTYAVHSAGFTPSAEARLDVETGTIDLVATAEVSQRTGEDWTNVDLALSTAARSGQTAAPPTNTWYIDIRRDQPRPTARLEAAGPATAAMDAMADVAVDADTFDVVYRLEEPQGSISVNC